MSNESEDEDSLAAFHHHPKGLVWYQLMRRYVFPQEESATGIAIQQEIVQIYEAQRLKPNFDVHEQIVGPTIEWIEKRVKERAWESFRGGQRGKRSRKRKSN